MLLLHVLQGPDRGKRFELPHNEPQLIGRSSESLPITDTTVSRRHAELTPDDGSWYIRDLHSANGTYLNGQPIDDRHQLTPGDQIRCGSTILSFAWSATDAPSTPIELLPEDVVDVAFEAGTGGPRNDDSMVLASPDPVAAAMNSLRVIYDLSALISETIERGDLIQKVMDMIMTEFRPDRGFILMQADPDDAPEAAAVRYRELPRSSDEGRIPVSRTIVQHALTHRRGVLSTNAMNDQRFRSGDSVASYGIRSAICAPIHTGDRLFGVIHIDSQLANFTFTEPQLQLLSTIGQYLGLALANAERIASRVEQERLATVGHTMASLSHSIKNILQGLRGGADALELAINRDDLELAKEGWPILARNLDRIFNLTLNMLTFSRKPTLDLELTSLNTVASETVELIQPQCDERRVGLILDLAEDMPPTPIDSNAMHQALMNLLNNALEAAPSKTGLITLTTTYDAASQEAMISVADNGPGIADAVRHSAFDPFVSTKGQRGTGLGLAVTQKIVAEHNGRTELESSDSGTTVRCHLPADADRLDVGETHLPRPTPTSDVLDDF